MGGTNAKREPLFASERKLSSRYRRLPLKNSGFLCRTPSASSRCRIVAAVLALATVHGIRGDSFLEATRDSIKVCRSRPLSSPTSRRSESATVSRFSPRMLRDACDPMQEAEREYGKELQILLLSGARSRRPSFHVKSTKRSQKIGDEARILRIATSILEQKSEIPRKEAEYLVRREMFSWEREERARSGAPPASCSGVQPDCASRDPNYRTYYTSFVGRCTLGKGRKGLDPAHPLPAARASSPTAPPKTPTTGPTAEFAITSARQAIRMPSTGDPQKSTIVASTTATPTTTVSAVFLRIFFLDGDPSR
ncbi:unnamed protein product [Darwinula stevensoni]|uniref:Uncharacterized protein n=1 Tax=Darwinula stevensoni TaxID=69355 RepID=A0A7R9AH06_9CRUS|nr:unnamed protein product [Darwinula stevensoni]CAG0904376.1 unnamed protein product [Darwinula stevensoni]